MKETSTSPERSSNRPKSESTSSTSSLRFASSRFSRRNPNTDRSPEGSIDGSDCGAATTSLLNRPEAQPQQLCGAFRPITLEERHRWSNIPAGRLIDLLHGSGDGALLYDHHEAVFDQTVHMSVETRHLHIPLRGGGSHRRRIPETAEKPEPQRREESVQLLENVELEDRLLSVCRSRSHHRFGWQMTFRVIAPCDSTARKQRR